MQRYAAFLRGVSPLNAKMPELKRALEKAGFENVKTVISSGNVAFDASVASEEKLAKQVEAAFEKHCPRSFATTVRSIAYLEKLLKSDPYADYELAAGAKRVVTFLYSPSSARLSLPLEFDGACIVAKKKSEVFSVYVPSPRGPVFMNLIEKTFGKDVTTRTWETLVKVARS